VIYLVWFLVLVVGFAVVGTINHGPLGSLPGAGFGFLLWIIGSVVYLFWSAFSVNSCQEYGHPDDSGGHCSNQDLTYYVEHH